MGAWKIKSEQQAATMRNKEDRQSLLDVFWAVRGCGAREREEPGRPELRSQALPLPLSAGLGWVALPVPLRAINLSLQEDAGEALEPWAHCAQHATELRRLGSSRRNVGPPVEKCGNQSRLHSIAALHLGRWNNTTSAARQAPAARGSSNSHRLDHQQSYRPNLARLPPGRRRTADGNREEADAK